MIQSDLPFHRGSHGGRRPGAGRKPGPNPRVRHRSREAFPGRLPCHVTSKVSPGLPSLRRLDVVREVMRSFAVAAERGSFRLLEFSIQANHVHAIVEAEGSEALGRGMKSLAARLARAVNRALGRTGRVLLERYHLHVLRTARIDPASSGAWSDTWRPNVLRPEAPGPPPVVRARSWLARVGWRRYGLLDPAEV